MESTEGVGWGCNESIAWDVEPNLQQVFVITKHLKSLKESFSLAGKKVSLNKFALEKLPQPSNKTCPLNLRLFSPKGKNSFRFSLPDISHGPGRQSLPHAWDCDVLKYSLDVDHNARSHWQISSHCKEYQVSEQAEMKSDNHAKKHTIRYQGIAYSPVLTECRTGFFDCY